MAKILNSGFALIGILLATGCASTDVEQQTLASRPNMQFSRSPVFAYTPRLMPQILPGLAVSGGAQASTCTLCR